MLYELVSEDLTNLGGPMGSEYTTKQSLGLFSGKNALNKAKKKAENDYEHGKLTWIKIGDGFRTKDLGYIMYHIYKRKVE